MDVCCHKKRHFREKVATKTTTRPNHKGITINIIVATMFLTMIHTIHRYTPTLGYRRFGVSSFVAAYISPAPYQAWNARFASQQSSQQQRPTATRIFSTTQENTEESTTVPDISTTDTATATAAAASAVTPIDFQFDMDDVISLCKRRGLIFPSSEIYNGYAGFYDYGPIGVELKRSVKDYWWKTFVTSREDVVGLDSSIIHNPTTWKSSGTSFNFSKCNRNFILKTSVSTFQCFSYIFRTCGWILGPNGGL
jgi:hypothetical protein